MVKNKKKKNLFSIEVDYIPMLRYLKPQLAYKKIIILFYFQPSWPVEAAIWSDQTWYSVYLRSVFYHVAKVEKIFKLP